MVNINYEEISMDEYKTIESSIDSMMHEKQLIETHKKLVGKSCKNDYFTVEDCGVAFIKTLFYRDWGRSIVYEYSNGAKEFMHSKYLSDYFKSSIKKLLAKEELTDEVRNAINSDKLINDMSEEELKGIYSSIKEFYSKPRETEGVNVASLFMSLLYKLDGKGVISFIKNNVDSSGLANHILLTSGLSDRASYYSGRGVNYSDLSDKNLVAIYLKLLKLDNSYATEFIKMVNQMRTLGATEFINSFTGFAANGFKSDVTKIEDKNVSLDDIYGEARDTVALLSVFSTMGRGNDEDYQIRATENMKESFMFKINQKYNNTNSKFVDNYRQDFNTYEYRKKHN